MAHVMLLDHVLAATAPGVNAFAGLKHSYYVCAVIGILCIVWSGSVRLCVFDGVELEKLA